MRRRCGGAGRARPSRRPIKGTPRARETRTITSASPRVERTAVQWVQRRSGRLAHPPVYCERRGGRSLEADRLHATTRLYGLFSQKRMAHAPHDSEPPRSAHHVAQPAAEPARKAQVDLSATHTGSTHCLDGQSDMQGEAGVAVCGRELTMSELRWQGVQLVRISKLTCFGAAVPLNDHERLARGMLVVTDAQRPGPLASRRSTVRTRHTRRKFQ
jgi:hypothetical protein